MKRIFIALAILLTVQMADAQVKSPADAKKAVEAAQAATENPKKAAKPATWLKLAGSYMDAYSAPMGNGWIGANKQELTFLMGNDKPSSTQTVTLAGEPYTKEAYSTMNYYFNANQQLAIIEVTKPVYEDALDQALKAYKEAEKVDAKGSKTKDIDAGIKNVAAKYMELGMNDYMFGDYKGASENFEKSVNAGAEAPNPVIDTMTIYNAGFTAWMAQDLAKAETFFLRCAELGYAEDGEVYAKLGDIYSKLDNKEKSKSILEEGFSKYPANQSIIIGLINYYIESGEQPDELFALLDVAKKNEPNNASLYYVEGDIHNKLGHKEEAKAAYLKSNEINPEYEFGLIGLGIMYYNEALELQEKASTEFDNAKYEAISVEFEAALKNAIDPFEKAFNISKDNEIKVSIAEYLKNIYYRFRDQDPKYMEGYQKYSSIVENGL